MSESRFMRLGDVTEILSGYAFPSSGFNDCEGVPVIRIRDVLPGKSQTFYKGPFSGQFLISDSDILIGMDGEFNRARWRGGPALLNQRVCRIRSDGQRLYQDYLFHLLPAMLKRIEGATPFVTVKHLSVHDLRIQQLTLPPLSEQRRIAAILDQADLLRSKRRATIAKLDSLTKSIFSDVFGDPVANPKSWPRVPFGNLLERIDSGWSPLCLDRPANDDEWGVLKLGAVTNCKYDQSQNKALPLGVLPDPDLEVQVGDLLFTRKNTYNLVAACAIVSKTRPRLLMSDLIFRFRLRADAGVNPLFLHELLTYPSKRKQMQQLAGGSSGSMPNISKARLQTAPVEMPPKSVQQHFASRVQKLVKLQASHVASLINLDRLFASLQHRAFRGEL